MGQRRMIDSDVLKSPDLYDFSFTEKYLWISLILIADDEGRVCVEREYLVAAAPGPWKGFSAARFSRMMAVFEAREMITTYHRDVRKYATINNFSKHQWLRSPRKSTRKEKMGDKQDNKEKNARGVVDTLSTATLTLADPCGDSFDKNRSALVDRFGRLFGFSPRRSREILESRGWDQSFVDAWEPEAKMVRTDPAWKVNIQNFRSPSEVPSDESEIVDLDEVIADAERREREAIDAKR